ncbi:MAG: serine hydrolase, partial [Deltaproteobacteria bacterium]|nr:serine hydrolase [Deltaproteobacteria bacterium]
MKKILLIALTVLLVSPVISQDVNSDLQKRLQGVDKELEKILETWNAAGFAVAVVERNNVLYANGFGYRDYENKIPATANTLFAIGSCSKSFTTSILGLLRKDDLLSFEDPPGKYIPELRFFNEQMENSIKIKDMMSHRTG